MGLLGAAALICSGIILLMQRDVPEVYRPKPKEFRPLSLTILAWLLIALGAIGVLCDLAELAKDAIARPFAWILLGCRGGLSLLDLHSIMCNTMCEKGGSYADKFSVRRPVNR